MSTSVRSEILDEVFLIRLEDASGFPRLGRSILAALHSAFDAFDRDTGLRGAVLTGTEKAFAVGADLNEVASLDAVTALPFSAVGQSLAGRVERSRRPVIAAVRGYCLGGGFDLALACRLRVAADDAVFAHRGASLGIITGWGGTARLPRIVGRARALEWFTTGREIPAAEALAARLVARVVPARRVVAEAITLARSPKAS